MFRYDDFCDIVLFMHGCQGRRQSCEDIRITWSYNAEKNEVSALVENSSAHDIEIPFTFVPWVDRVEADGKYTQLIDGANEFTALRTVKSGENSTETASLDFYKVEQPEAEKPTVSRLRTHTTTTQRQYMPHLRQNNSINPHARFAEIRRSVFFSSVACCISAPRVVKCTYQKI